MSSTPSVNLWRRAISRSGAGRRVVIETSSQGTSCSADSHESGVRLRCSGGGSPLHGQLGGRRQLDVEVDYKSQEWGGLAGLDSSSCGSDLEREVAGRRERYAMIARQVAAQEAAVGGADVAEEVADGSEDQDRQAARWCACLLPLFFFVVYNAVDGCLVYMCWQRSSWFVLLCMAPSCLFLCAVETCLAWTDRDIARIRFRLRSEKRVLQSVLFQAFVVLVLGFCFGHHLMMSFRNSRRFDAHRTFLTHIESLDPSRQALAGMARWDCLYLIWGPPVVLTLVFNLATGRFALGEAIFWSTIVAIVAIGMIVDCCDYDFASSHHIRTETGTIYDDATSRWIHRAQGAYRARRFQCMHALYRASEAALRIFTFAALAAASSRLPGCVAGLFAADVFSCIQVFCWASSPSAEVLPCAIASFFFDVAGLVDEPGFAYLGRRVSSLLSPLRLLEVVLAFVTCWWLAKWPEQEPRPLGGPAAFCGLLLGGVVVAFALALAKWTTKVGDAQGDIFTAVAAGSIDLIEESLTFQGGCTLNMRLCHASRQTAAHFAVLRGQDECAAFLVQQGADIGLTNAQGDTLLHAACRMGSLRVVEAILHGDGSRFRPSHLRKVNAEMKMPIDLLGKKANPKIAQLLREEGELAMKPSASRCRRKRRSRTATVASACSVKSVVSDPARTGEPGATAAEAGSPSGGYSPEIYGDMSGGQHFHIRIRAGSRLPQDQVGRLELASFMFSRGVGEQAERLIEHLQNRGAKVRLAYLETVQTLGSGAFGRVMEVRDVRTGQTFAMKLQKKDRASKQAVREACELDTHRHNYIVELIHIFHTPVFYGILMELCELDLNRRILQRSDESEVVTGLPGALSARYTACVAIALEYLHSHEVVFRDLKPENILITSEELGDLAKLTDFGMAKSVCGLIAAEASGPATQGPTMTLKAGTLAFMSGEAMVEDAEGSDGQAYDMSWYAARDWYGLGCCLLLMLLGERGGRKVRHGRREVLLPPPHPEVLSRLIDAMDEELLGEEEFDLVTGLTDQRVRTRANSVPLRNSVFLGGAFLELEEFPVQ